MSSYDEARQCVIGRESEAAVKLANEIVVWDGIGASVRSNEVFTAEGVADLFVAYYLKIERTLAHTRRP